MAPQNGQAQDPLAQLGTPAVQAPPAADPLSAVGTPAIPPASSAPEQPGVMSRVWEGAKQFGSGVAGSVENMVKPPETPTEGLMSHVGGDPGLFAYRAAKAVTEAADRMVKAVPGEYQQAVADFKKASDEFHNKDYRNAAASAGSGFSGIMSIADPLAPSGRELTEGTRKGGNLATPLTRDALIAGTVVAPEIAGDAASAVSDAAGRTASKLRINPFRSGPLADAADAVRGTTEAAADTHGINPAAPNTPILQGNETVLDEPIKSLASKEKAAYKRLDEAAGFDLKAAKDQMSLDQRAVKQPGMTPETLKSIQTRMADNEAHISQAEKNLTDQGIDPKEGDRFHTARMAGQDFKNAVVKAANPDGTVNIDKLVNQSKNLRFMKRGDRLEQFMGKEGADEYMSQLMDAQKAGIHAMKVQKFMKWAATIAGVGLVGAAGVHGAKAAAALLAP